MKNVMGKFLMVGVAVAAIGMGSQAKAITIGLAIDGSGSIAGADFELQRNGYINALTALLPIDGSVSVGVWQFGAAVVEEFAVQNIASQVDKDALLDALSVANMPFLNGGATALGPAIDTASAALLGFVGGTGPLIIDVSTDGFGNIGTDQVDASNAAILAGINQINGLGVGGGAVLNFVQGVGSFGIQVNSFADFQTAIEEKLGREFNPVPEPITATLGLMGLGALATVSRRRRAA